MKMSDFAEQIRTGTKQGTLMGALRELCGVDLQDLVRQAPEPDPQWIIWNSGEAAAPEPA
jgi:hypothetical protein